MMKETKELKCAYFMLIIAFAALIGLGMVNVFSATFVGDSAGGNFFYHLSRQALFCLVGLAGGFVMYKLGYRFWQPHMKWLVLLSIILLAAVLVGGIVINGARRWLGVGIFTFQPSEVAKLASIIYAAVHLSDSVKKGKTIELLYSIPHVRILGHHIRAIPHTALWVPFLMFLLVMEQPDAGTAFVIVAIPIFMVLAGGARLAPIKWHCAILAAGAVLYLLSAPYRLNRITAWLDPWEYQKTLGYQTVQGLIAIGSGGISGQGLGNGISKFQYLPEAHTDFAFAILAQESGLIGSVIILLLFCMIVYFGMMTVSHCRDSFGMFTALGITLYFGGQGFINISMVCGLLPVVGVPLPFISYGGTSLVINMLAASLLLNICRHTYKKAAEQDKKRQQPILRSMKEETRSQFPLR